MGCIMAQRYLVIALSKRRLLLYQDGHLSASFPVAVGKGQTPTPVGNWHIINKKILTDNSVFGSRWLGLNHPGYGIHGTNQPDSIGTAVSHGCIRMYNADVEQLFQLVSVGTPVIITT
jgi:lipoprotein-anchoring transpeptidase ErfK/SrfK